MTESTDPHIPTGDGSFDFPGNPTGSGGTLSLDEINTIVTNMINQLPNTKAILKSLLTQLQQAIISATELSDANKANLLEATKNLAQAGQTSDPGSQADLARRAKTIIDTTIQRSPNTTNLADVMGRLLPLILNALGVPVS